MILKKLDKKSLQYLGIIIIIAIVVCIGLFYYFSKEQEITVQEPSENPMREILKSLSASEPGEPISEELQEGLSASDASELSEDTEDILKSLTAPE